MAGLVSWRTRRADRPKLLKRKQRELLEWNGAAGEEPPAHNPPIINNEGQPINNPAQLNKFNFTFLFDLPSFS